MASLSATPILDGSNTPVLQSSAIFDSIPREAGAALETYKQRDTTKGPSWTLQVWRQEGADKLALFASSPRSGRAVQGDGERSYYEAELLQDHLEQPVPDGDCILAEGAGVEAERCAGEAGFAWEVWLEGACWVNAGSMDV